MIRKLLSIGALLASAVMLSACTTDGPAYYGGNYYAPGYVGYRTYHTRPHYGFRHHRFGGHRSHRAWRGRHHR